jgi:probable rRNA maturation factor
MTPENTRTFEPGPAGDEESPSEDEQPRPCADVSVEDDRWLSIDGFSDKIQSFTADTLTAAGLEPGSHALAIALMSDAEVHALNKAFRAKDAPTNVLSFPSAPAIRKHKSGSAPVFLGDVALAYETVVREAQEQDKPVFNHAAHLVVHGVLHLAGFDHETGADAERMEAAERQILARLGIPDPYGEDAPGPGAQSNVTSSNQ